MHSLKPKYVKDVTHLKTLQSQDWKWSSCQWTNRISDILHTLKRVIQHKNRSFLTSLKSEYCPVSVFMCLVFCSRLIQVEVGQNACGFRWDRADMPQTHPQTPRAPSLESNVQWIDEIDENVSEAWLTLVWKKIRPRLCTTRHTPAWAGLGREISTEPGAGSMCIFIHDRLVNRIGDWLFSVPVLYHCSNTPELTPIIKRRFILDWLAHHFWAAACGLTKCPVTRWERAVQEETGTDFHWFDSKGITDHLFRHRQTVTPGNSVFSFSHRSYAPLLKVTPVQITSLNESPQCGQIIWMK